jgi:hypothetical protein
VTSDQCACGHPLHYRDPATERAVRQLVAHLGPDIQITTPAGTWLVPRHYVALHGISEVELPQLADRLGFPRVRP